jgi:NADH:ubiquinone oxidoreductase subunit 6 (subunit J)
LVAGLLFAGLLAMFTQVPGLMNSPPEITVAESDLINDLGTALVDVDRFVLAFELASVLLLAALVGAIVVARPVESSEEGGES